MARRRWSLEAKPRMVVGLTAILLMATYPVPASAQSKKAPDVVHHVKPGENLWAIAKQYLGRGALWPRVYQANRQLIGKNPSLIRPGMRLRLDVSAAASHPSSQVVSKTSHIPQPPVLPKPAPEAITSPVEPEKPQVVLPPPELVAPEPIAKQDDPPTRHADLGALSEPFALTYLPVASSLVVPGSGQAMQGRWEKGVTHLGLMAVSLVAFKAGSEQGDRPMQVLGGLGLVGIALWSPWDAYQALTNSEKTQAVDHP